MSKANEFAVEEKVTAIRATMSGLSSSFKEKLRLPLPIPQEARSSHGSSNSLEKYSSPGNGLTEEDADSGEDSPSKSRRSQSAFMVNCPKHSYFEEEEESKAEDSETQLQEEFKPSPRFNLSVSGGTDSEYVSNYVAYGQGRQDVLDDPTPDSFRGLHIPNQYEFTLVRSRLEEEIAEKDKQVADLKTTERKMEVKLAETLQSLARTEEELSLAQQRNKALVGELEEARGKAANRQELLTLQLKVSDFERMNADLRRQLTQAEKQLRSMQSEYETLQQRNATLELDSKTLREQKSILEDNLVSVKKGILESSARVSPLELEESRAHVDRLRRENTRLIDLLRQGEGKENEELVERLQSQIRHLKRKARKSSSPVKRAGERSQSQEKHTFMSPKESYTRDLIRKDKRHHSSRGLLREALHILSLPSPDLLLPHIEELKQRVRLQPHTEEFIRHLQDIVLQCSPPEAFSEPPSLHQIWKWLRRLVEEYMNIRKTPDFQQRLMSVLRVRSASDILKTVESVMSEYERLLIGLSRIKAKLRLPLHADVEKVADELEVRLRS